MELRGTVAAICGDLERERTDVGSRWYRHLDKPAWQPPGAALPYAAWVAFAALLNAAIARRNP